MSRQEVLFSSLVVCNFLLLRVFKENVIKMSANSSLKIFLMKECKVTFWHKTWMRCKELIDSAQGKLFVFLFT